MTKNRPPKKIREKYIQRCKNKNCKVILKDCEDILEGFCYKCRKFKLEKNKQWRKK